MFAAPCLSFCTPCVCVWRLLPWVAMGARDCNKHISRYMLMCSRRSCLLCLLVIRCAKTTTPPRYCLLLLLLDLGRGAVLYDFTFISSFSFPLHFVRVCPLVREFAFSLRKRCSAAGDECAFIHTVLSRMHKQLHCTEVVYFYSLFLCLLLSPVNRVAVLLYSFVLGPS